jgi:hypothetical protein
MATTGHRHQTDLTPELLQTRVLRPAPLLAQIDIEKEVNLARRRGANDIENWLASGVSLPARDGNGAEDGLNRA